MENKKVDNELTNVKQRIYELDNKIDDEKKRIKKLDDVQESITSLNKSLNTCIELLSKSMKGPTTDNMFADMRDSNKSLYANMTSILDDEINLSQKVVNNLFKEKDNIIKENKNQKE